MMQSLRRRGRPPSALRARLVELLAGGSPLTARELGGRVGVADPAQLTRTLDRMLGAGQVRVVDQVRVDWAKRPVARYAAPTAARIDAFAGLQVALSTWGRSGRD
jgi:predicted transcriptional regulator